MAAAIKDSFLDLERHRQLLQDNIEKLKKDIRHWQMWEAEYEGLKEDILSPAESPSRAQLLAIGNAYEGELVTRKEVNDILGAVTPRTASQVVNVLDRRMDYVQQNVRTVQKQIEAAENKLTAATVISTPTVMNEEGLPMTEIMEELDEEGNVISSHISTPGSAQPQLLEVLQKAGVKDIPDLPIPASSSTSEVTAKSFGKHRGQGGATGKATKKGVKFAEDTKPGPEPTKSQTAKRIEEIMAMAKESESTSSEPAIIPTDDSAEDAALRRDMLQYGMSEVGAVVAELNLEDESEWSDEDYVEDESDDEDSYGRSTGRLVDDELRQRMIELEERLGARVMQNIGKKASDKDIVGEGIGRVSIAGGEGTEDTQSADDAADIGSVSKVLADIVIERDIPPSTIMEPDNMDSNLLHQEAATEYHKMRNLMIHRQGGFIKEDESEIVPLTEEEGGPKKMSRFKAARLSKS